MYRRKNISTCYFAAQQKDKELSKKFLISKIYGTKNIFYRNVYCMVLFYFLYKYFEIQINKH